MHTKARTAGDSPSGKAGGGRYLREQVIADRRRQEGRSTTYQSIKWPKCYKHPDRSTKDSCGICTKPICAMCSRRRGSKVYCPSCISKVSGVSSRVHSAKFTGFSGSYLETVKEVLFSPSVFFRNLPTKSGNVRPFLFAVFNWVPGNTVLFLVIAFFMFRARGYALELDQIHSVLLEPLVFGVLALSVGFTALGWIPFHVLALVLGGKRVPADKSFRMFSLASAVSMVNVIPFIGVALSPLFATVVLIRAVSEVYDLDIIRAFLAFLVSYTMLIGGVFLLAKYYVFAGI
jgi:hypothetical protein